ncbi:hypothetical protein [Sphingobacterium sp. LRF_L2]|uniref:hypothetical protein n=1 Tax=Sphingobacterium sp. LRF_L2 TaxID=3369421 RepID=UPI003F6018FE
MNKYVKNAVFLVLFTGIGLGIHTFVLNFTGLDVYWERTDYSLVGLYTFGAVASLLIAVFLFLTDFAMPKYLSFVFLGGIMLKILASYLYIKSGLNVFENDFLELNFLVSFFIFLLYDVYVAYQLVNQEVKVVEK